MWPRRKNEPLRQTDSETLTKTPRRIRFNLFHRSKDIVGKKGKLEEKPSEKDETKGKGPCRENRPKVNLFPQVSLNDLRGQELDNVLDYMYSSDWKEAAAFTATASRTNLIAQPTVGPDDLVNNRFLDRFRRKSSEALPHIDLPRSEVDLVKWYKSLV